MVLDGISRIEAWGRIERGCGSLDSQWAPQADSRNGIFWVDRHEHPCRFRDESAEEELWRMCQRMSGQAPPPAAAPRSQPLKQRGVSAS